MTPTRPPRVTPLEPAPPGARALRPIPGGPSPGGYVAVLEVTVEEVTPLDSFLVFIEVWESVNAPARCRVGVQDAGPSDSSQPPIGAQLAFGRSITVSPPQQSGTDPPLFRGRIYGLGGHGGSGRAPVVEITGLDGLYELSMTRRSRAFEDVAVGDVLTQVAHEHGLTADILLSGAVHESIVQANRSDLDFLRDLARELDLEFWVEGGTFRARIHLDRPGDEIPLAAGGGLLSWRCSADLGDQRRALVVSRWDVAQKAAESHIAGPPGLGQEAEGLLTGAGVLEDLELPSPTADERIVHLGPSGVEQASGSARSRFAARARGFVRIRATAQGDPRIRVGARVNLSGMGARFEGLYRVVAVRHAWEGQHGYRTEFEANRTGVGP